MSTWRSRVSPWVPPVVSSWAARRTPGGNVFTEFDGTWAQAVASVRGYDDATIIDKVAEATRAVERGEAAFERDSVLFEEPEYSWPLLAAILHAAGRDGRLSVLDFGGALGSTYRQHRRFLEDLPDLRWTVVEQGAFVDVGRREFQTDRLRFASTVAEGADQASPTVVLLGSSLQYMEDPDSVLDELTSTTADTLIIDRTPLWDGPQDVLCIQTVPASIYAASYPMWILSRPGLTTSLADSWSLVAEYESGHRRPRTTKGREFGWDGLVLDRG